MIKLSDAEERTHAAALVAVRHDCFWSYASFNSNQLLIRTSYQSTKVNSCFGREQLQMLHVGQNSCKCFSNKSKIGGRALHHQERGYLHQATNCTKRTAAKARAASRHVGQCNTRACQPAAAQYSASASTV